jgi:hypothetical protein
MQKKTFFFLSFLVSDPRSKMELRSQLDELVQRTERTEAEVELLLAELGGGRLLFGPLALT